MRDQRLWDVVGAVFRPVWCVGHFGCALAADALEVSCADGCGLSTAARVSRSISAIPSVTGAATSRISCSRSVALSLELLHYLVVMKFALHLHANVIKATPYFAHPAQCGAHRVKKLLWPKDQQANDADQQ